MAMNKRFLSIAVLIAGLLLFGSSVFVVDQRQYAIVFTLGEFKRDMLVPGHDLAMSERQSPRIPTAELDLEQALRFLKRTELHQDHPGWVGWGVVKYKGRNLGWIKALPGRINNHFPKEMRIRSDLGLD